MGAGDEPDAPGTPRDDVPADATGITHGEGPEVRGASRPLVTVLGGRPEALAELEGDGADEVRRRLAPG